MLKCKTFKRPEKAEKAMMNERNVKNKEGGKYLAGLDTRRMKESTLFASSVQGAEVPTQMAGAPSPTPAAAAPGKKETTTGKTQVASMTFPLTPTPVS